jgi:KilA-N domain
MAKQSIMTVEGTEIKLLVQDDTDYISLTDIDTKFEGSGRHIENWLRNQNTIEYLATWELLHNPNFNSMQLHGIKENIGINRYLLSAKKWIESVNAIGIKASAGRYGGTFAHRDIAFHFCLWLSPTFQLYVAKEFQRLKEVEAAEQKEALDWNLKRTLAKINYRVHTDAVKTYLIPPKVSETNFEGLYYASEADILNVALFGRTAKAWREENPTLKGNIRDEATTEQLLILSNLENLNAEFLKLGMDKHERLRRLNETAIHQMGLFMDIKPLKELGEGK